MNNLTVILKNFFDKAWSQLCDRRNQKKVRVNRYAQLQRTDILVRKNRDELNRNIENQNDMENMAQLRRESNDKILDDNSNNNHQQQRINTNINNDNNHQQQAQSSPIQIQCQVRHPKSSQYEKNLPSDWLFIQGQQTQIQQYQHQQSLTLFRHQIQLDEYEKQMDLLINQFKFLQQEDTKRKKQYWKEIYSKNKERNTIRGSRSDREQQQIDLDIRDNNTYPQLQFSQQQINNLYKHDITNTIQLKYTYQLVDYPLISKQTYTEIRNLWAMARKKPNYIVKQLKLNFLQKLTARSFRTLSIGTWLNDEIINGYLQMIDNKCQQYQRNHYRVLNSFFAQTTFAKTSQVIQRVLKRKKITPNHIIIIAINTGNHWLFAEINNGKIIIHDSIRKQSPQKYIAQESPIKSQLENIQKFANTFYGTKEHQIKLDMQYPQQQNGSDCGMFLLCGIKDIVRNYQQWSFDKNDINYKRFQVASQMLNQKLQGFPNRVNFS